MEGGKWTWTVDGVANIAEVGGGKERWKRKWKERDRVEPSTHPGER